MKTPLIHTSSYSTQFRADVHSCSPVQAVVRACMVALLIIALLCIASVGSAQEFPSEKTASSLETVRIGITAGYGYNLHNVNFLNNDLLHLFVFREHEGKLPDNFRSGIGKGVFAGVVAEIPFNKYWHLSLRGIATQHDAMLQTQEIYPTRVGAMNEVDTNSFSIHTLIASMPAVGVEALIAWRLPGTGLRMQGGVRSSWLLAPSFRYEDRFHTTLNNADGVFVGTEERVRMPLGVEPLPLPNAQFLQAHALGGIGYEIPLGEKLRLTPEIFYTFALTNVFLPNTAQPNEANLWSLHQVRGGITLTLPLFREEQKHIPPPPDTVQSHHQPTLAVRAVGVQNLSKEQPSGQETERVVLRIQQTISRSVLPLLPYLFFDGINATAIPDRYALLTREETATFRETKLSSLYDLMPKEHSYYHLLNIIGERLRRYPKAILFIHGCTDSFTAEKNRADVAKARGRLVYRYFREIWNIEEARLKLVENTTSPATPSVPLHELEKQAENRRVELRSDNPAVVEHITLIDTLRRAIAPTLRFYPRAQFPDSIRAWTIAVRQHGRVVKEFSGDNALPNTLDWHLSDKELSALHLDKFMQEEKPIDPLEYSLSCTDAGGNTATSSKQLIAFERITEEQQMRQMRTSAFVAGKLIERFNLILFDFAKSSVTKEQEPMMNLIKSRITSRSTVRVDGFTDRTGLPEFNQQLSLQRASNVAQMLGFSADDVKNNVTGYGASVELYNNDLPEGRFYSRTVRVIVETANNE